MSVAAVTFSTVYPSFGGYVTTLNISHGIGQIYVDRVADTCPICHYSGAFNEHTATQSGVDPVLLTP